MSMLLKSVLALQVLLMLPLRRLLVLLGVLLGTSWAFRGTP